MLQPQLLQPQPTLRSVSSFCSYAKEELPIEPRTKKKVQIGADDPRLARAIFTLKETAAYLDIPKSNVQRWARPLDNKHPLLTCFPPHGREATVPFIGFAEAFVLSSFRRAGVPLQRIRPAVEVLAKEIGVEHALASERLYTDGAEVLFDYASRNDESGVKDLVVVRTKQSQFSEVVEGYLKRIHYGGDGWADSVQLPAYGNAEVIVTLASHSACRSWSMAVLGSRMSSTGSRRATRWPTSPPISTSHPMRSKTSCG